MQHDPAEVLSGVYVANVTPFRDDERYSIDVDAYVAHVAWLAAHGATGVMPFGTNGEGPSLSTGEKLTVLDALVPAAGSLQVVPTVAEGNLPDTLDLLAHLEDLPVRAVMAPGGVERLGLSELFARSNAVTLHLPLTRQTRGLVDADLLGRMPAGSYLVNTSRGALVDVDAVVAALDGGRLAGVGLDVLPEEPPPAGHPLVTHPRALLSPHVAWYSEEAEVELLPEAAQNVVSWAATGRPDHVVVEGR